MNISLPDLTQSVYGYIAVLVFVLGYLLVLSEHKTHLAKSKPMMVAAGVIWILVALAFASTKQQALAGDALRASLLEYAELFLFLLSAMTFVHTMEERHVFLALKSWLVARNFSLRTVFWLTGLLTFVLSPVADNLSTALLMGAVVMAVGRQAPQFVILGSINIVVAANAGGVFSPFGDITSLMVWQKGKLEFIDFFNLILPAFVNWLVPAVILNLALKEGPPHEMQEHQRIKKGGISVIVLFLLTTATAVMLHSQLQLPPALTMMTGLGALKIYMHWVSLHDPLTHKLEQRSQHLESSLSTKVLKGDAAQVVIRFDNFRVVERSSWDTLMFFYGVVLSIGGLAALGYLNLLSNMFYGQLGPTITHILVGLASALVDNIPVMYAILSIDPVLPEDQWLLVTLTIGVGGSILSIGSAAGIALMGQASGLYTFWQHLKWSWAIVIGYLLSVGTHLLLSDILG